jgi:hypothetical protein
MTIPVEQAAINLAVALPPSASSGSGATAWPASLAPRRTKSLEPTRM